MESYVIRIYRRDLDDPRKPVGMVEVVETSETRTFTHVDELVDILCPKEIHPLRTRIAGDRHDNT